MNQAPSILTNLAFHQSRVWREAVTTICRTDESPDDLCPVRQAFRLLKLRSRHDAVVTLGPRPSLIYGLLCGLLHLPSRQIMTEVFLDEPRPASLPWRVKTVLFRWIARRSIGILTNSSAEVGYIARRFAIPEERLRFVPMYTTIERPGRAADNDGYVLSIGHTRRDWNALLRAAPRLAAPLVLVVGQRDRLPEPLPQNVRVFRNVSLEDGRQKMRRAALVAIPLLPAERSTGQVVLFEAMALGKPVVATRVAGTVDYIRDGENGILVEPSSAPALEQAINRLLKDPALANRLASAALADCAAHLDPDAHAARKIEAIQSLWTTRREARP